MVVSPRAASLAIGQAYEGVPVDWYDEAEHRRFLANGVNQVLAGKLEVLGEVTLAENVALTNVEDPRISVVSFIDFQALTANAAVEKASGNMYITTQETGKIAIAHTNNAQTDRSFRYIVLG